MKSTSMGIYTHLPLFTKSISIEKDTNLDRKIIRKKKKLNKIFDSDVVVPVYQV